MKISVEEFMRQEAGAGKKSRLDPYEHEILTLKSNGYSYEQIIKFLSQNDIEISKTALHHFVKSRNADKKTASTHIPSSEGTQNITGKKISRQPSEAGSPVTKKTGSGVIGKFVIDRDKNVEELM
jgi:hypothetical protein